MTITKPTPRTRPDGRREDSRITRRRQRERRTTIALVAGVVLTPVLVLGAWFAYQANHARVELNEAAAATARLQDALAQGDQEAARAELAMLQSSAGDAHDSTDSLLWALVGYSPFVGDDVRAVRTVAYVMDDIATAGLPPAVESGDSIDPGSFAFRDGRLDLDALTGLGPTVSTIDTVLQRSRAQLDAVPTGGLTDAVRGPVDELTAKVGTAADATSAASRATRLLPTMLGSATPRRYLLLFQSNAEIRATGGFAGAYSLLTAQDGRIELTRQGEGSSDFPPLASPVLPLSADELELFDPKMGTYFVDANFTPDFARAAELQAAMYQRRFGTKIDGVLSIDPVTLGYLLEGTGPVAMADGSQLNGANAADQLLNQVYVRYTKPDDQDAFFKSAAQTTFRAFTRGVGDPRTVLSALGRGTREGRVQMWAADDAEQAEIAGTTIAGTMPGLGGDSPEVGVYLNDATGAKMQYYLDRSVGTHVERCDDGAATLTTTVKLRSDAPNDSATLPSWIRGPGYGAEPGTMSMNLYLYAPEGGTIGDVRINGESTPFTSGSHLGRPVGVVPVMLGPGDSVDVTALMTSTAKQTGRVSVRTTPGVRDVATRVTGETCG